MVKEGNTLFADFSFKDEKITIGSKPDCSIHLPDMRISPQNAIIAFEGENWLIKNTDPDNKILVNDHVMTEDTILQNDDEITLHDYVLKIHLDTVMNHDAAEITEHRLTPEELAKITKYPLPPSATVKRHYDIITLDQKTIEQVASITVDLAVCRDIHELIDISLKKLLETFEARMAWIGIRRKPIGELEVVSGRLRSGQSCDTNPMIEQLQYRCFERKQHICVRKIRDIEKIGTAMAVPLATKNGSWGMIYIDRIRRDRRFQPADLDVLSVIGSQIAAKLEAVVEERNLRLAEFAATEVSVVSAIQAHLDPKSSPDLGDLQLAAYSRAGQENPGDVYDLMQHPDTKINAFLMGHVNATGALLALSMARLHSTFRVGFLHNDPPHALARSLNWLMYDEKDPSTVDTIFLMIDPPSGKIKYARAGKIGAFIVNNQGLPRPLQGLDSPPIGQVRNFEYVSWMEQLTPGETLVLYTRGAASSTNADGQRFGETRFIEMICDGFCQPPSTTIEDISYELTSFFENGKHPDDISVVLLHRPQE